ncbi:DUF2958 domain-containing protein [Mucilaginibacter sp. BJC16-A38]|uniref:DUF2958 domain-containing protein n=1 Tax=Mucilaginibacter phenanthrenivorans TaxID=1234842 RepID=UPI002157B871|nr:DUF2958 domain-containing protein [Mucilaginibacter phenanthrenivorans]MCR8561046.1 DUF2958 domain-containing protein [Mucilaginibacter phenanthrenivorans]
MKLFTKSQYEKLIENGRDQTSHKDHPPVVKLFMTCTDCTWLISELDPEDSDIAFGLCDLGMGFPELGTVFISELENAQDILRFLERDLSFEGTHQMSVYANAAYEAGEIVTDETTLNNIALKLKL